MRAPLRRRRRRVALLLIAVGAGRCSAPAARADATGRHRASVTHRRTAPSTWCCRAGIPAGASSADSLGDGHRGRRRTVPVDGRAPAAP